jgi:hypothetical protein
VIPFLLSKTGALLVGLILVAAGLKRTSISLQEQEEAFLIFLDCE